MYVLKGRKLTHLWWAHFITCIQEYFKNSLPQSYDSYYCGTGEGRKLYVFNKASAMGGMQTVGVYTRKQTHSLKKMLVNIYYWNVNFTAVLREKKSREASQCFPVLHPFLGEAQIWHSIRSRNKSTGPCWDSLKILHILDRAEDIQQVILRKDKYLTSSWEGGCFKIQSKSGEGMKRVEPSSSSFLVRIWTKGEERQRQESLTQPCFFV